MRLLSAVLILAIAVVAAVHGYFYFMAGTVDPCEAAVTRLVQKEKRQGQDLTAGLGTMFSGPIRDMMRNQGVATCYRTALTGQAPDIQITIPTR